MEKQSCSLDITVISAEGLSLNRHSIKKNTFVTVKTDPNNSQSTKMDTEGGSYPSWNEKLALELPCNARMVTVEVQCKTSSGVRTVGTANIPVSDFIGNHTPANYLHFLSYRLRERDGERNGIVNLSVKVKGQEYVDFSARPWCGFQASERPWSGFQAADQRPWSGGQAGDQKNWGGIVAGMPWSGGQTTKTNSGGIVTGFPVLKCR
ncbi:hypothetical protein HHK36_001097 [Tetracentron sinense]|uniref:C2 domain-containing protein n=1 Tax=Tetracentron sinense TaxID=13715 RepID=A0A835A280_TETSI|nr:hypothetical protein HHK36_001097 [Tetracentron sinense]